MITSRKLFCELSLLRYIWRHSSCRFRTFSLTSYVTLIDCDTFVCIHNTTKVWQRLGCRVSIAQKWNRTRVWIPRASHSRIVWLPLQWLPSSDSTLRSNKSNGGWKEVQCTHVCFLSAWLPSSIRPAQGTDKPRGFNLSASIMRQQY